ncbi:MAG: hypothetical protein ACYC56_05170 [Candidatus Aquicultor sp.]
MKGIKRFFSNFEDTMVAVTFAEAGELETARQIMAESESTAEESKKVDLSKYQNKGKGTAYLKQRTNTR